MMRTENEIKAMTPEQRQKMVIDLRDTPVTDKFYATAKALIEFTVNLKGWKEPVPIEVKNIAGHKITVDGKGLDKDATIKVFPWQFAALARFLEPVKAIAAMLMLLSCIIFAAQAQTQTTALGAPGQYWVRYIAALNGGTNSVNGATTNSFTSPVTNSVIITNANWQVISGVATNEVYYSTNSTITVPGTFSIVNYDEFGMGFGFALRSAGTGSETAFVDYSPDNIQWQLNKWTIPLTASGTTAVWTNVDVTGVSGGYARLDSIGNTNATIAMTNVVFEVAVKASHLGP
jgi:hypothetical protein